MIVLGVESSCDETGIALYDGKRGLLAHAIHSQIDTHKIWGGVVPELASRDHIRWFLPLLTEVLSQASLHKKDIDAVAYTFGPGLIGALLTGACFAKSFAYGLGIPSFAVHHLEGHILACMLDNPKLSFPFLALLVSGGHSEFIWAESLGNYKILGSTLDDAVGEAFDKTAKLMGIPYPGGAELACLADSVQSTPYRFPRPMLDRPGLDLSFSGLKTHAVNVWQKSSKTESDKQHIAHAFQEAVVETLIQKATRALDQTGGIQLVVAGGVGANQTLRKRFQNVMSERNGEVFFPRHEFCTDNGAMIAYAGFLHLDNGKKDVDHAVYVKPRLPIDY